MTLEQNIFSYSLLPQMALSMIPKNPENESQKVRLPWSASPIGIQCHQPHSENLGMRTPVKSRVPAILSTVSNFGICPTQLDCEISRIRLKLHTLYATVPLTSQAVHFRVTLKPEYWSMERKRHFWSR